MNSRILVAAAGLLLAACAGKTPVYLNPDAPVSKRVEDLLGRMTLEEKVGQMNQYTGIEHIRMTEEQRNRGKDLSASDSYHFYKDCTADSVEARCARGLIGSFLHVYTLEEVNRLQRLAMSSRLGIPAIFGIDAVHGNAFAPDNTVYPTSIGLASTFDRDLVWTVGRETALEMRAMGLSWTFAPGIDVSRDSRWGRCGETFGEDPYLVGEMGVASVRGLQGEMDSLGVLTTIKHLVAGGQSVNGANAAPTDISDQTLEEVFLPPYRKAIEAGALGLMPAHNDICGIPCHANKALIEGRVRGEWGFRGIVVSDWLDVERLANLHFYATDTKDAFRKAIDAGLDVHMHGTLWQEQVCELVREGAVSERRIDESVRRILEMKFRLGLFENPYADAATTFETRLCPAHRETALRAARESVVLLKNEGGILPLKEGKPRRVLVTGINADSFNLLGDWAAVPKPENVTTILEGLRDVAPGTEFVFVDQGLRPCDMSREKVLEAARKASGCDLAIVVAGDFMNRRIGGMTCGENHDRADTGLPGLQKELFERVAAAGKPVVLVLVSGRPLAVPDEVAASAAVLNAWEPGMYGGQAVAEILYGRTNPSGKLSMTMPKSSSQSLICYNSKPMTTLHPYIDVGVKPLFPFGYGLSYTEYKYSNLSLSAESIAPDGSLTATVEVRNVGEIAGDETVQMYLRDMVSSRTRPIKELKGFERIHLEPGESRTVTFSISRPELEFYGPEGKWIVEPGKFRIMVGGSSLDRDLLKAEFEVR